MPFTFYAALAYHLRMHITILDVGQCGFDGPTMKRLFEEQLGASVHSASTADEARRKLASSKYDLVLVNREFAADGDSGIDLIEEFKRTGVTVPVMLVSDRPEAQEAAVKLGALPGFGKSALDDPATYDLIARAARHKHP